MFKVHAVALAAAVLMDGAAHAESIAGSVRDVAVIGDGSGAHRILFRFENHIPGERTLIERAILKVDLAGEGQARTTQVRVHPVMAPWDPRQYGGTGGGIALAATFRRNFTRGRTSTSLAARTRSASTFLDWLRRS